MNSDHSENHNTFTEETDIIERQSTAPWRGTLYFDISALLQYARSNDTLTGIQRVEILAISKILERFAEPNLRLIGYHPDDKRVKCWESDFFRQPEIALKELSECFKVRRKIKAGSKNLSLKSYIAHKYDPGIKSRFHKLRLRLLNKLNAGNSYNKRGISFKQAEVLSKGRPEAVLAPLPITGDIIFVPGATWSLANYLEYLTHCSERGIKIVQFIHDLVPLITPEHVVETLPKHFYQWLSTMARIAESFVVNSQCTGRDLSIFLDEKGFTSKPISVVPLAHEFVSEKITRANTASPKEFAKESIINGAIRTHVLNASHLPFILCVGTREPRKNMYTLVKAWIELSQELKSIMPRLVFAGKNGWMNDEFDDILHMTRNVCGLIKIVEAPNDAELEYLYRNCRFSVYMSYYEGWGLPVGESLWLGRPVLASTAGAVPEVGGAFVDYADPYSLTDIIAALRLLIIDDNYLASRVAAIQTMQLRSWLDVANDLVEALAAAAKR